MTERYRKLKAYALGLAFLILLGAGFACKLLTEGVVEALSLAAVGLMTVFTGGNVGEHYAARPVQAPPPTKPFPSADEGDE